jgi:hypothetical protein
MRPVAAIVLLLLLAVPAESVARRERPETMAPLLGRLRAERCGPLVRSAVPRRLYVIVTQLTPSAGRRSRRLGS